MTLSVFGVVGSDLRRCWQMMSWRLLCRFQQRVRSLFRPRVGLWRWEVPPLGHQSEAPPMATVGDAAAPHPGSAGGSTPCQGEDPLKGWHNLGHLTYVHTALEKNVDSSAFLHIVEACRHCMHYRGEAAEVLYQPQWDEKHQSGNRHWALTKKYPSPCKKRALKRMLPLKLSK